MIHDGPESWYFIYSNGENENHELIMIDECKRPSNYYQKTYKRQCGIELDFTFEGADNVLFCSHGIQSWSLSI